MIGSGFAGLSAAAFMARRGWQVVVLEKNGTPGGRAQQLRKNGFTFDMGPSWYWMPDVFERYFRQFGRKVSDYYTLHRLDPSYRVYWHEGYTDISPDLDQLRATFESIEPGSAARLDQFLKEAAYKYRVGVQKLVYKPGRSLTEFLDPDILTGIFRLDVFTSIKKHVAKYFSDPRLRQIMEFPILFLGALPENTPALYSLMNYADIVGGTWYPEGGMYAVVQGMYRLAQELGVDFHFDEPVQQLEVTGGRVSRVTTGQNSYEADAVISGADYHFTETQLLDPRWRSYSDKYWKKRVMAPSCLLYYVGLDKRLENIRHHSLFFDVPFGPHAREIYANPQWPQEPLFYVSANSVTDPAVAPPGKENLVFLIPVAAGLEGDTDELRESYFRRIAERMERHTGQSIRDALICKETFSVSDFTKEYHSFRGNAYGLANTLRQTAVFKPACRSRKVGNLFYTGQLTVPGPGVPPSLISGEVVAQQVDQSIR